MPLINLTDAELAVDQPIKASHLKTLRDGINQLAGGGGAVGSYAMASYTGGGIITFGQLVDGSLLSPAAAGGSASGVLSGGWVCHGYSNGTLGVGSENRVTLWLRVS